MLSSKSKPSTFKNHELLCITLSNVKVLFFITGGCLSAASAVNNVLEDFIASYEALRLVVATTSIKNFLIAVSLLSVTYTVNSYALLIKLLVKSQNH